MLRKISALSTDHRFLKICEEVNVKKKRDLLTVRIKTRLYYVPGMTGLGVKR
jgi:hypothetical protein